MKNGVEEIISKDGIEGKKAVEMQIQIGKIWKYMKRNNEGNGKWRVNHLPFVLPVSLL